MLYTTLCKNKKKSKKQKNQGAAKTIAFENMSLLQETNCFERSTDGYTCSMCNTKYNMEIMLKLHMAAAHPEFAHKVFDKGKTFVSRKILLFWVL